MHRKFNIPKKTLQFFSSSLQALLIFIINTASSRWYKRNDRERTHSEHGEIYQEKLLVYHRGSYVPMRLNEIAMIDQIAHINWLITFNNEEYILDSTLKEISMLLNQHHFFQINRNQIVNKEMVKSFSPGTFGKIELTLKSGKITRVSKGRAKEFRKWLSK